MIVRLVALGIIFLAFAMTAQAGDIGQNIGGSIGSFDRGISGGQPGKAGPPGTPSALVLLIP